AKVCVLVFCVLFYYYYPKIPYPAVNKQRGNTIKFPKDSDALLSDIGAFLLRQRNPIRTSRTITIDKISEILFKPKFCVQTELDPEIAEDPSTKWKKKPDFKKYGT
ncbi:hypothetical protein NECAME_18706, partial [Necator americanus]